MHAPLRSFTLILIPFLAACNGSALYEKNEAPSTGLNAPAAADAPSPADAPVLTAAAAPATAPLKRSMIYSAALRMVVPDTAAAQRAIQSAADVAGGYLTEIDGSAITVRVPAARFDALLASVERLGEVTYRKVKANDVTEELRDLHIRLDNAERLRTRLQELLKDAARVEDTLKIESELQRVTESIELLKGKLQYLNDQVAFSTLRVELNSARPNDAAPDVAGPFSWIRELADGAVTGTAEASPDAKRHWARNERFALPPGFVRYFERDFVTEAMSADGVLLKLKRHDNYEGGDLAFWNTLARRSLLERRAIALSSESDLKLKDGTPARLLLGSRDTAPNKQAYLLGLAVTDKYVYTFEAWAPADKLTPLTPTLQSAFWSLDIKHW